MKKLTKEVLNYWKGLEKKLGMKIRAPGEIGIVIDSRKVEEN